MTALSPAEQLVGAVLNGRFRLIRLLGSGGMGTVYEAESLADGGKRAIKLLRQDFVNDEQTVRRFLTEAVALRALQHPNIAQVFDAATSENGTPYLVMELLNGTPLSKYVEHGHVLPPLHAVQIVGTILRALAAAHSQNVIHRDIKPENVFLVRDPNGAFVVKVLDFGIAKVLDAAGGMGPMTRTGVLLGTPGYMSPEQIKNSKAVDARTDLWSVGVIFYELLSGKPPFPADNEFARLSAVLDDEMRPIGEVEPHLAHFGPFFRRALAKNPADRFGSAEEMGRSLGDHARSGAARPVLPALAEWSQPAIPIQSLLAPLPPQTGTPTDPPAPARERPSLPPAPLAWSPAPPAPNVPSLLGPWGASAPPPPPGASPTQPSLDAGAAIRLSAPPAVEVRELPPSRRRIGAPWWLVALVALVAFGLGLGVGLWVAAS